MAQSKKPEHVSLKAFQENIVRLAHAFARDMEETGSYTDANESLEKLLKQVRLYGHHRYAAGYKKGVFSMAASINSFLPKSLKRRT